MTKKTNNKLTIESVVENLSDSEVEHLSILLKERMYNIKLNKAAEDQAEWDRDYKFCADFYKKNKDLLKVPTVFSNIKIPHITLRERVDRGFEFDFESIPHIADIIQKTKEYKECMKNVKQFFKLLPKEYHESMIGFLFDKGIMF